jgi:hypothetical protein
VDLESGEATVEVNGDVSPQELLEAVEDKVILSWARTALTRLRREES